MKLLSCTVSKLLGKLSMKTVDVNKIVNVLE